MTQVTSSGRSNTDFQLPSSPEFQSVYAIWNTSKVLPIPKIAQQPMAMFRVAQAAQRVHNTVSGK
jgi:hypothetical protein